MGWLDLFSVLSSAATAIGIFIAAAQVWFSRAQAVSQFEDGVGKEYRDLASDLPVEALLGEDLSDEDHQNSLDEFYHYFDLSNEQIFLRQCGRITLRTWTMWCAGIRSNMRRPAFARAWEEVKRRSNGDFDELRRLEEGQYKGDPREWSRGNV